MDGLSALSVAASVAQFIQFGCSLVSKSKEIYQSANGLPVQQVETASAARRLVELSERIKISRLVEGQAKEDGSADERALETICEGCISMSEKLLSKLEKLKIEERQKYRRFKSFRQALKSVWSKEAVDEIARRLAAFQSELDAHLLVSLSEKFNSLAILHDKTFDSLDQQLRQSIKTFLPYLVEIHQKMQKLVALQRKALDLHQREGFIDEHKDELARAARKRENAYQNADTLLLQELWFPEISHRHMEIEEAHKETFAWILQNNLADRLCAKPGSEGRMWHNFAKWLQESDDIYWINGKAGSGKSTLMRYICDNEATFRYLESWGGLSRLQMFSFYFWKSGSKEQRSQIGLLRSLLYGLLKGRKDIIRVVFEEEWDYFVSSQNAEHLSRICWSFPKLEKAFHEVVRLTGDGTKTCFFIDGLDELEGDPEPLVVLIKRISEVLNVKVCLSSRPWRVFEEHFEGYPGLRVQDLTYDDIRLYVRDRLEENSKMQHLVKLQPLQASALMHNIVAKANGVFLWVKLVVWSLLDGLRNRDDIPELQKRLDRLPSDLDALYRHMLQRIDPLYMTQACRIFQIFNVASDLQIKLTVLELDLAVTATYADAMNPSRDVMSDEEISQRCDRMSAHLQTRCEGLLEVHDLRDRHWEGVEHPRRDYLQADTLQIDEEESSLRLRQRVKADLKVAYLHRTVRDFLAVESVREILLNHAGPPAQFEPHMSLLMAYVINLKSGIRSFYCTARISHEHITWTVVSEALLFAQRVHDGSKCPRDRILNEFSKEAFRCGRLSRPGQHKFNEWTQREWRFAVLSATVKFGLTSFVESSLRRNSIMHLGDGGASLLAHALGFPINLKPFRGQNNPIRNAHQPVFPSMVKLLLTYGANPNEMNSISRGCISMLSPWKFALYSYYIALSIPESVEDKQENAWAKIIRAMLEHGADRDLNGSQLNHYELPPEWGWGYGTQELGIICSIDRQPLLPLINDLRIKQGLSPLDRSRSESVPSTVDRVNEYASASVILKRPRTTYPSHLPRKRNHNGLAQADYLLQNKRYRAH